MGNTPPYIAPTYEKKKRFWQRALGAHIWEFPYMGPIYEKKKGPQEEVLFPSNIGLLGD